MSQIENESSTKVEGEGILLNGLLGTPAQTRKTRAKRVATNIAILYRTKLDSYHAEIVKIDGELERLIDLNSTTTFSTAFEVDADTLVTKRIELIVKRAKLKETLDYLSADYKKLVGAEYVPAEVKLG